MTEFTANFLWKISIHNFVLTKKIYIKKIKHMSKIHIKKTKPKQSYKRFFLVSSCYYNGGKHQLSRLESTNFSEKAKSMEASKANQRVILLPLIHEYWDLEDSQWSSSLREDIQGCCICQYVRRLEPQGE